MDQQIDPSKKVTIRVDKVGDLVDKLKNSYSTVVTAVEASLICDVTGFQLHVLENQCYITMVFAHAAKAALYRGYYVRILEDQAGLNLDNIYELSKDESVPEEAKKEVDDSF